MANAARLEIDLSFGGKVYTVKPTFEVISGIESATGQACIALARKCYAAESKDLPSLTETGQIVYNLLRPFGGPSPERVGEILLDDGCVDLYIPLGDFLSRALRGNKDHIRQVEEASKRAEVDVTENPPQPAVT